MKELIIFTDGSCMKNIFTTKCGYGVHYPGKEIPDVSEPFNIVPNTNQRTELYAIYRALTDVIKYLDIDKIDKIIIYSDSEYSIKSITLWIDVWEKNGWKTSNKQPVKNLDIIKKINDIYKKYRHKIKLTHVRAHTGKTDYFSIHNDIVDKLAKSGAERS
jgi:ribonuclease HI